jgi:phosphoserine phosphatase
VKLLVLDVEGTIFESAVKLPGTNISSTIWQGIAHALGPEAIEREVATHALWEKSAYKSYLEWMEDTIRIHQEFRLRKDQFFALIDAAQYSEGVTAVLPQINRDKFTPLLISGGFRELARRAQADFAIRHAFAACEYIFGSEGEISGYNLLPCDFEGKIDFIRLMLRELRLGPQDWVFVGDGVNDVPIACAAPLSVGFRPHPKLSTVTTYSIESFRELPALLRDVAVDG